MPAAVIPAIIGAAGSIGAGAIGASAAGKASKAQAGAAQQGINTIQSNQQNTLGSLAGIYGQANNNLQPYQNAGTTALNSLSSAYANPTVNNTGSVTAANAGQQWGQAFQAPTADQAAATPGFQFDLENGQNALLNHSAALGNLRSGSTAKGLVDYSKQMSGQEYQNAYGNALNQYNTNFNAFQTNRANLAGGLQNLASGGQNAATTMGQLGSNYGSQLASTNASSGQSIASLLGQQGAATASGYVGAANAWGGALQGAGNAVGQGVGLNSLNSSAYSKGVGRTAYPNALFG